MDLFQIMPTSHIIDMEFGLPLSNVLEDVHLYKIFDLLCDLMHNSARFYSIGVIILKSYFLFSRKLENYYKQEVESLG